MASPQAPLASQTQPHSQRKQHPLHMNHHDDNDVVDKDESSDQDISIPSARRPRSSRTTQAGISPPPTAKPRSRSHKHSKRRTPDHLAPETTHHHHHHHQPIPQSPSARQRIRSVPTAEEDETEEYEDDADDYDYDYDEESEAQQHLVSIPPLPPLPSIIDPPEGQKLVAGGKKAKLAVELKLNLEIEIELRAYIHGDLTLELFN